MYIGQTGKTLGQRLKEHQRTVRDRNTNTSALVDHVCSTGHQVDLKQAQILDSCPHTSKGCLLESRMIQKHPSTWTENLDLYRLYTDSFPDLQPPPILCMNWPYSHVRYLMVNYCFIVLIIIHALPHIISLFIHHHPSSHHIYHLIISCHTIYFITPTPMHTLYS